MKKTLSLILFLILILFINIKMVHAESWYQDSIGNWHNDTFESLLDESYYSSLIGITNKDEFYNELHNVISYDFNGEALTKYSYGSDTRTELKYIDEYPGDESSIISIYTGEKIKKDSSTWNQEHVWAKSHGFPENTKYENSKPYCDLNHLRSCQSNINSSRSNSDFYDFEMFNTTPSKSDEFGNLWTGTYFEPMDSVKGDIARICFYMYVRYNGDELSDYVTLLFNNTSNSKSEGTGYMGCIDCLVKWHMDDPVDDFERRRNDRVELSQGNRNPFIDHPEYANILFDNCNYELDNKYTVTYKAEGATFSYIDTKKYEKGAKISVPYINPYKKGYEFTGWYKDKNCTTLFDFENDIIESNLVLYAGFFYNPTLKDLINFLPIYKSLKLTYKSSGNGVEEHEESFSPLLGPGTYNTAKNNTIDLAEYFNFTDSEYTAKAYSHEKPNFYIKANEIRMYNYTNSQGTEIVFTPKNNAIAKNVTIYNGGSNITDSFIIAINNGEVSIKTKKDSTQGNTALSKIVISYSMSTSSYEIKDKLLDLKVVVDDSLYNFIKSTSNSTEFKFILNKEAFIPIEVKTSSTHEFYLKDIDLDKITTIDVYFEVLINNETIKSKSYNFTVKDLIKTYLEMDTGIDDILNYIYRNS